MLLTVLEKLRVLLRKHESKTTKGRKKTEGSRQRNSRKKKKDQGQGQKKEKHLE